MPGGVIGLIPYVRMTGQEFLGIVVADMLVDGAVVDGLTDKVRGALAHRDVDMTAVLSEADFEFGTRVALREHWRAIHGEVDTWDANARARGVDPRPLQEAVE